VRYVRLRYVRPAVYAERVNMAAKTTKTGPKAGLVEIAAGPLKALTTSLP